MLPIIDMHRQNQGRSVHEHQARPDIQIQAMTGHRAVEPGHERIAGKLRDAYIAEEQALPNEELCSLSFKAARHSSIRS